MKLLTPIFFALSLLNLQAQVIPQDRVPVTNSLPWHPGTLFGPGNTPVYTNWANLVTDYSADPTGVTDISQALSNAVAAVPANSAIYLPAGTYKLNFESWLHPNMVLRGAGIGKTIIKSYVDSGSINSIYLKAGGINASNFILSGYNRGSTNLTLNTTTGITPGCFAVIQEMNNPAYCVGNITHSNDHCQIVEVKSVSGGNITISRPIYFSFAASQTPNIFSLSSPVTNTGLEDFTLDCVNSGCDGIWVYRSCDNWIKRVAVTNVAAVHTGISLQYAFRNELKEDWSAFNVTPTSSAYGYQLVSATDNLVWDSIGIETSAGWLLQFGSSGNVIAYNYFGKGFSDNGWPNCLASSANFHGDIPNMNLLEGNVLQGIGMSDTVWGANLLNMAFRNWVTAANVGTNYPTDCRNAIQLSAQGYTNSIIGNVLMLPQDIGVTPSGSHSPYTIDPDSAPTLYMTGNFDFMSNATQWSNGVPVTLPPSLFTDSKPLWFGSLAWPPVGPDVNTTSSITNAPVIPAMYRYQNGTNPPSVIDPQITVQPTSATVTAPAAATFSVTATGTATITYQWYRNGSAIGGATSTSYTTPATSGADNGANFYVIVTNGLGGVQSSTVVLTVNGAIAITQQPQNKSVPSGATARFSVTATGAATISYQWYKNGVSIGGATTSSYTTPATTGSNNGDQFYVILSNPFGTLQSSTATLTVTPAPSINLKGNGKIRGNAKFNK
jgi:hypothetical protein